MISKHDEAALKVAVMIALKARNPRLYRELKAAKAEATIDNMLSGYEGDLQGLIQELLRGGYRTSKADFRRQMKGQIRDYAREGFRVAWEEGGGDVAEAKPDELAKIDEWKTEQQSHVNDFSDWLTNRESDLDAVPDRLALWAASFENFLNTVKAMASGDPRLLFKREPEAPAAKEPCATCAEYDGEIKRLSTWEKLGLLQRNVNDAYDCGHWDGACFHHFYNPKTGEMVIN